MDSRSSTIIKEITIFLMLKHEGEGKLRLVQCFFVKGKEKEGALVFPPLFFFKDLETALHLITSHSAEDSSSPRTAGTHLSQIYLTYRMVGLVFFPLNVSTEQYH